MRKILISFTFILFLNCTKLFNTDTDEGTISGKVTLEEMSNHSGITISLYEHIGLDPDMVAINQEYPNIGVIISQRTEFDHRSHYPEFETTTEQNGNFSLENIPYNDYIVVCEKSGFGYHYIFYLSLSTNNYELQTVNLLAERQVSGTLTENTTWESGRHYIVTSDVEVPEAVTLTIEPGAVIRFSTDPSGDGFYKLKVRGTLIAVGDSLNWINFTSNVGLSEEEMKGYGMVDIE